MTPPVGLGYRLIDFLTLGSRLMCKASGTDRENEFMRNNTGSMAMTARKSSRPAHSKVPVHPEYNDEIGIEQMDAIRKLADPDGKRAARRVALYPSLV